MDLECIQYAFSCNKWKRSDIKALIYSVLSGGFWMQVCKYDSVYITHLSGSVSSKSQTLRSPRALDLR